MKKQHLIIILLFSFLLAVPAVQAQKKVLPAELEVELKYGADRLGKRQDPAMQKFRENRLGAFIHWGLYAIPGGEWNNKTYHGAAECVGQCSDYGLAGTYETMEPPTV